MTKYEPLTHYLDAVAADEAPLTFAELESILGFSLPKSAFKYRPWWANQKDHVPADSWMKIGWQVWSVNLDSRKVMFRRLGIEQRPVGRPPGSPSEGAIIIPLSELGPAALKLIEEYAQEHQCDPATSAAAVLNAAGVERRKAVFDWFRANATQAGADSADLIREDRDAR